MQSSVTNPEKLAVVAVTRDETKVWRHGIGPEDLPEVVTTRSWRVKFSTLFR